jgi:hypothetical protein
MARASFEFRDTTGAKRALNSALNVRFFFLFMGCCAGTFANPNPRHNLIKPVAPFLRAATLPRRLAEGIHLGCRLIL